RGTHDSLIPAARGYASQNSSIERGFARCAKPAKIPVLKAYPQKSPSPGPGFYSVLPIFAKVNDAALMDARQFGMTSTIILPCDYRKYEVK
ncbi:MAG: hypothetical protein IJ769_05400, partial [Clostridia bacterium]|nr:hypothetical protein [Clostridia bacterium]